MKALVTDNVHEILLSDLKEYGYEVTYIPNSTLEEVFQIVEDFEVLIINSKILVDAAFLDQAKKLKIIGRLGSGLEIIDLEYAAEKKVQVYNSPEGNRDAVGEHAIGMLLSLFNQFNACHNDFKNFSWDREARRGVELKGKTVGIIGYGNTGKAFAKKLSGFDVEVLFYDKYLKDASDNFAKQEELNFILQKIDILSLHLPYLYDTHHFFNEELLKKIAKPIYLINTSRGKVINTSILTKNVKNGNILGLCLDVFENEKTATYSEQEKLDFTNLIKTNKVLFTTHVAGWTQESKYKLAKILSQKIIVKK